MKSVVKILTISLTVLTLVLTCKPSSQRSGDEASGKDLIEKEDIEQSLKKVAYPLPQPFEVYAMLEEIGATYLGKILNPVENTENYFTQRDKAINIGVYAADLGYAVTYDNQEDVKVYSRALKSLIDDLGVRIDYSKIQTKKSQQEVIDKDSLVAYISDVFYDTYTFLYKENTPSLAGLMAAGAWTEGVYIATHISDDTYNNTEIVKIIHEQGQSLDELISLLSNFEDDERVGNLIKSYNKLSELYQEAGDALTEEQLKSITSVIETIRESIIS
ncbi:MAG: hypothetical protein PVF73_02720 [Bacteroidales bacterium]|jgi:hypothetical protein